MNIFGKSADEFIFGSDADDFILPRAGRDIVFGRAGNDLIVDTPNDNIGSRFSDDDFFFGGVGNDTLVTNAGRDVLLGGKGDDHIYCEGIDSFVARGGVGFDVLHLGEQSQYIRTRVDGMNVLTLDSETVSQTIYIRGFEEVRYDAPLPL